VADSSLSSPIDQEIGLIGLTFKNSKDVAESKDTFSKKKEDIIPTIVEVKKSNFMVSKYNLCALKLKNFFW
jgi:hypothetical protein